MGEQSAASGFVMTINVSAKAAVYGEDAAYFAGLTDLQRAERVGFVKAELRRFFREELDEAAELEIDVRIEEVGAE